MGLLQKISWKTRRWNFKIHILNIYLHDGNGSWGIDILTIVSNYYASSLFSIMFRLPNGAEIRNFTLDELDFFFLRSPIHKEYERLSENKLWGVGLSRWDDFKLRILDKIIR